MPCRDWYPEEDNSFLTNQISELEAMLCGVLSVLRDRGTTPDLDLEVINMVNEKECGVKINKIQTWWREHQDRDNKRKGVRQ